MARWLVGAAVDFVEALVGARAVAEDLGVAGVVGGGGWDVAREKDSAACGDEVGVDLEAKFGGEGEEEGRGVGRGCVGGAGSCCGGHCDWKFVGRLERLVSEIVRLDLEMILLRLRGLGVFDLAVVGAEV